MKPFWAGILFGLAFFVGLFVGYSMGGTDKMAYVADLSRRCTADGGALTIEVSGDTLTYNCKALQVQAEIQEPLEECVREREVIHKLIREDYKRTVTGI